MGRAQLNPQQCAETEVGGSVDPPRGQDGDERLLSLA
jgi:hypothetical protein